MNTISRTRRLWVFGFRVTQDVVTQVFEHKPSNAQAAAHTGHIENAVGDLLEDAYTSGSNAMTGAYLSSSLLHRRCILAALLAVS